MAYYPWDYCDCGTALDFSPDGVHCLACYELLISERGEHKGHCPGCHMRLCPHQSCHNSACHAYCVPEACSQSCVFAYGSTLDEMVEHAYQLGPLYGVAQDVHTRHVQVYNPWGVIHDFSRLPRVYYWVQEEKPLARLLDPAE